MVPSESRASLVVLTLSTKIKAGKAGLPILVMAAPSGSIGAETADRSRASHKEKSLGAKIRLRSPDICKIRYF